MRTMAIPSLPATPVKLSAPTASPTTAPATAPLATEARPLPMPQAWPGYGAPYGYPPYGVWPGYAPMMPPMAPQPAAVTPEKIAPASPIAAVDTKSTKTEPAVPLTAAAQAEEDVVALVRDVLHRNPQLRAQLTPEVVDKLKAVAHDPTKLREIGIKALAKSAWGSQIKSTLGTGWFSRMAQKWALKLSPAKADPLVDSFFKELAA